MQADELKITVLEDGRVKIETDKISGANHASAERAIAALAKLLGGSTKTIRKSGAHTHTHNSNHNHEGH